MVDKKTFATFKAVLALALVGLVIAFLFPERPPRLVIPGIMLPGLFTLGAEIKKVAIFPAQFVSARQQKHFESPLGFVGPDVFVVAIF